MKKEYLIIQIKDKQISINDEIITLHFRFDPKISISLSLDNLKKAIENYLDEKCDLKASITSN